MNTDQYTRNATGLKGRTVPFALLASPFLAAASWREAKRSLIAAGHAAVVLDIGDALSIGPEAYARAGEAAARQLPGGVILVAHSGAGALAPSVVQAAQDRVLAVVFVDALLPHAGRSWFETAPVEMVKRLRAAAVGGTLPPWPLWWPNGALASLLPDPGLRAELEATAPRAPLAYLDEPAPTTPRWPPPNGCAYLRLSDAYEREAEIAAQCGWPVRRLDTSHLAILSHPGHVADAMIALASELASPL